jgi:hypothetical protein
VRPTYWFFDTVSLLTMTLDPGFEAATEAEVARTAGRRLVIDVVVSEMEYRAEQPGTDVMAKAALEATDTAAWTRIPTASVDTGAVGSVQLEVNDGRPLDKPRKHWAESVMITMFRQLAERPGAPDVVFVSDDYDARRVANLTCNVRPCHLAALLYAQYRRGDLAEAELLRLADITYRAGRGPEILPTDLARGWRGLGRAGHPPF